MELFQELLPKIGFGVHQGLREPGNSGELPRIIEVLISGLRISCVLVLIDCQ